MMDPLVYTRGPGLWPQPTCIPQPCSPGISIEQMSWCDPKHLREKGAIAGLLHRSLLHTSFTLECRLPSFGMWLQAGGRQHIVRER